MAHHTHDLLHVIQLLLLARGLCFQLLLLPVQAYSSLPFVPQVSINLLYIKLCQIHNQPHIMLKLWHWNIILLGFLFCIQILQICQHPHLWPPHINHLLENLKTLFFLICQKLLCCYILLPLMLLLQALHPSPVPDSPGCLIPALAHSFRLLQLRQLS
ncbi:hypothetical protein OIU78_022510 [Salix suchowensis]|nr:hypothetical protein OIU78_022510 [Salix suchowensis]